MQEMTFFPASNDGNISMFLKNAVTFLLRQALCLLLMQNGCFQVLPTTTLAALISLLLTQVGF